LTLGVRPDDISIVIPAPERLNGEVVLVQPQGGHAIVGVETSVGPATVVVPSDRRPAAGAIVGLLFESEALHLFDSAARSLLHSQGEGGSG
jgi:ABC-type sugar transport system ATPase subunit